MGKQNNLTDFLTDIADSIRAKKGTTEKINPQKFSAEIASIQTQSQTQPQPSGTSITVRARGNDIY